MSRAFIEARLGRPPQDMLEAAVALEAWAGVPAQRALEAGAELMRSAAAPPLASRARVAPLARRPELLVEGAAFVASVIAVALWAAPLGRALGADGVRRALTLALPVTLALQWGLRSRYLARPRGLASLAADRGRVAAVVGAAALAQWLAFGAAGLAAALLTLTWTASTVLMRRGWALGYAALVLAVTPALSAASRPLLVLAATAAAATVAAAAALRRRSPSEPPGSIRRAGIAALLGAALGAMLVADPSVAWSAGAAPALALLPSAVGGIWAGDHLRRLEHAIPRALAGLPAIAPPSRGRVLGPVGVLAGAVARLAAAAVAGSIVVAAYTPVAAGLLVAFAVLALATLLIGVLEALRRAGWASAGVGCALATELAVRHPPFAGASLAAGATVGALVLLAAALPPLLRPARTLATTLWIA